VSGDGRRYCPECDDLVEGEVCPVHRVATFLPATSKDEGLRPGRVVGERYEIVRLIGRGAMGAVYVARQMSVDREVALKIMDEAAIKGGNESIQRFYREARNASRLSDPHIVKVHDFGVDEALRLPYIVMERVEGETLGDLLKRRGPLPLGETCTMLAQVARALSAAHDLGIIHRDLKPDNIMVRQMPGNELHVTVLDFGIAKRVVGDAEGFDDVTATGAIVGTPRYMSPEQVSGDPISPRSDLYALGCIFYELMEGKPPFSSDADSNVMLKHVSSEPPPLVPEGFEDSDASTLYLDLMAKLPAERPATAAEVSARFKAIALEAGGNVSASHSSLASVAEQDTLAAGPRRGAGGAAKGIGRAEPRRLAWGLLTALGILVTGLIGAVGAWGEIFPSTSSEESAALPIVPTPLTATDAVLACPLWRAEGVDEPSGWLGAAAADSFCRRAQWMLGGRAERVLTPAAVAGMPPFLGRDASLDPFGEPGLRERSLEAARKRASAWADGVVVYEPDTEDFTVEVELFTPEGKIGGPFEGRGRAPFEAAWEAMALAEAAGAVPMQPLDPVVAHWWFLESREAAFQVLENAFRQATSLDVTPLCRLMLEQGVPSPAVYRNMEDCGGVEALTREDPRLQGREPRALAWRAITSYSQEKDLDVRSESVESLVGGLEDALEGTQDEEIRFLLDLARGFSLFALDSPVAGAFTRRALSIRPTELLEARQSYGYRAEAQSTSLVASRHAWTPHAVEHTRRVPATERDRYVKRAFILSGGSRSEMSAIAYRYGHGLVKAGRLDEAKDLAAQLLAGHPNNLRNTILLEAEVGLAEGRFRHVVEVLVESPEVRDYVPVVRHLLTLAKLAPELEAEVRAALQPFCESRMEKEASFDDALLMLEVAGHLRGRLGRKCLQAFDVARPKFNDPAFFEHCRDGLERWMNDDAEGAVSEWRQIRPPLWGCRMPIGVFDQVDASLASKLDEASLEDTTYGGAHPAQYREAKRAARRGNWEKAKHLARRVIEAWSTADVALPATKEMQGLLQRGSSGPN